MQYNFKIFMLTYIRVAALLVFVCSAITAANAQCVGSMTSISSPPTSADCGSGSNLIWDGAGGGDIVNSAGVKDPAGTYVLWTATGTFRLYRTYACRTIYSSYYTVQAQPAGPTASQVNQQVTCGSSVLNYTGSSDTFWQITVNGTDETYKTTRTVTSSGTYYARTKASNGCWSLGQPINVTIATPPAGGTLTADNGYTNLTFLTSVNINLSWSGQGASIKQYYYTENGVTHYIAQTSSPLNVVFQNTSSTTVTRVYYAVATNGGCDTPSSSVTISTTGIPTGGEQICPGGTASLSISDLYGGCTAGNIAVDSGPGVVTFTTSSGANATVTMTTPGTYVFKRVFSGTACGILEKGQTVIVKPAPAAPAGGNVTQQIGCGQVTLIYNGTAPNTYWQTAPLGIDTQFLNTRVVTASGDYYARSQGSNGCFSPATSIHVNPIPVVPTGGTLKGDQNFTGGNFVASVNKDLFLFGQTAGSSIKEYRYTQGGSTYVIAQTTSPLNVNFQNLTGSAITRVYWAVVTKDGCDVPSSTVTISVNQPPPIGVQICSRRTASIPISDIGCAGSDIVFAAGPVAVNPDKIHASHATATLTTPGIYVFKRIYGAPCNTEQGYTVEVLPAPAAPAVSDLSKQNGCGQVTLNYNGTAPNTYWQTNSEGVWTGYPKTMVVNAAGDYYANTQGSNGCFSPGTSINVGTIAAPPNGGTLSANNGVTTLNFLVSAMIDLNITGNNTPGSNVKEYRYTETGSSTSTPVNITASTLPVNFTNTTNATITRTYWAVIHQGYCDIESSKVTINVDAAPTATTWICAGQTSHIYITKNTQCTGGPIVLAYGPGDVAITPEEDATFTVPGKYVFKRHFEGCNNDIATTIVVYAKPDAPPAPIVVSRCNDFLLGYNGLPQNGEQWNWLDQNQNDKGNSSYTYAPYTAGTYSLKAIKAYPNNITCASDQASSIAITTQDLNVGTVPIPFVTVMCNPDNTVLLTSDNTSDRWFDSQTSLTPISADNSVTTSLSQKILYVKRTVSSQCFINEAYSIDGTTLLKCHGNVNSIRSKKPKEAMDAITDPAKTMESTIYFDGLGRPIQNTITQGSPAHKDIVTPMAYDKVGREAIKYLPYTGSGNAGLFYPNSIAEQKGFYTGTANPSIPKNSYPYQRAIYEPSPLNRVLKQVPPGDTWQPGDENPLSTTDYTIKKRYEVNKSGDNVLQLKYDATNAKVIVVNPSYLPNTLYVNITYDEGNSQVIEYRDKEGRTICKKVQSSGTMAAPVFASTYYLYDDFGNLAMVLPPEAVEKIKSIYNVGN